MCPHQLNMLHKAMTDGKTIALVNFMENLYFLQKTPNVNLELSGSMFKTVSFNCV